MSGSRGRSAAPKTDTYKIGDVVELDPPSNLVVLPDGSVVTCRDRYIIRHTGEHRVSGTSRTFTGVKAKA